MEILTSDELKRLLMGDMIYSLPMVAVDADQITIENCEFRETVELSSAPIFQSIRFVNVIFTELKIDIRYGVGKLDKLVFEQVSADVINLFELHVSSLEIIDCVIHKNLHVSGQYSSIAVHNRVTFRKINVLSMHNISIINESELESAGFLTIELFNLHLGQLHTYLLKTCILLLNKSQIDVIFKLQDLINSIFRSEKCKVKDVEITGEQETVHFKLSTIDNAKISTWSRPDRAELWSCGIFMEDVTIKNLNFYKARNVRNLSVYGSSVISNIVFGYSEVSEITISACQVGNLILPISTTKFDRLILIGDHESSLEIKRLFVIDGVLGRGLQQEIASISVDNVKISHLRFFSFTNSGNLYLSRISGSENPLIEDVGLPESISESTRVHVEDAMNSSEKVLEIFSSDMGSVNFASCDFSEFRMELRASKIVNIFLSGTKMPEFLVGEPRENQIGYGQLKKIYESMGDSVSSSRFLSLELDSHFSSLCDNSYDILQKGFWDRFTLFLNKVSNNFNQSWIQAFCVGFLIVMPLIYKCYCGTIGYEFVCRATDGDWENFWKLCKLYPEFLHPFHDVGFVFEFITGREAKCAPEDSIVAEFTGRVVSAYFIYQFVQAFRKFGKGTD